MSSSDLPPLPDPPGPSDGGTGPPPRSPTSPSGPPPPPSGPSTTWGTQVRGVVPARLEPPFYGTGVVILLTIVTFGVWSLVWTYRTCEDLRRYNGVGLGGVVGVIVQILLAVVLMFTIPNEIEGMYRRDGRVPPVSAMWGLWFLLPVVGNLVWYVRVQRSLDDFWRAKGAVDG